MTVQTQPQPAWRWPILTATVSRKVVVSLSGLFLILFLVIHLGVNLTMLGGADLYNQVAHWMGHTLPILAMRPVLALGFVVHLLLSVLLWAANRRSRPQRYAMVDPAGGSTWPARNMLVLGALILAFLVLHLANFSIRLTFGAPPMTEVDGRLVKDVYSMAVGLFSVWWYAALYVLAVVLLGLHLSHGCQSALQTLGLSDRRWRRRWTVLGNIYAVVVAVGFALLPVIVFVQSRMGGAS